MAYTFARRAMPVVYTTLLLAVITACGGNASDRDGAADTAVARADSASAMSGSGAKASTMANSALDDTSIIHFIAAVDQGETAAGRLASTKARNADVKAYARMIMTEHDADLAKLGRLASTASVTLDTSGSRRAAGDVQSNARGAGAEGAAGGSSSGMTSATGAGTSGAPAISGPDNAAVLQLQQNMQQVMSQLQVATGAEFDRQYIASQLAGHQQVLDLLQQNEARVQNPDIRRHVTATRTAVEKHLERARQLQAKMGGDSAAAPAMR